jgi:thioesterase domain-containing protein
MLQTIRAEGSRPPFFVVHGFHGAMAIGHPMGRALDADQPLYVLHARGLDGREPPDRSIEAVLSGYLSEIRAVRPHGPYVIGGVCSGSLLALDLARALTAQGERVGRAVLMDPPTVPASQLAGLRNLDQLRDPGTYRQIYGSVEGVFRGFVRHFGALPFDVNDPAQLHRAIEVGIQMVVTFTRYVPQRFQGSTEFIVSADRALGHLHPQGPWQQIVPTPSRVHVVRGTHLDFYFKHLAEVLQLLRFALESPFDP